MLPDDPEVPDSPLVPDEPLVPFIPDVPLVPDGVNAKLAVDAYEADTELCAQLDVPNNEPVMPCVAVIEPVTTNEPVIMVDPVIINPLVISNPPEIYEADTAFCAQLLVPSNDPV